MSNQAFGKFEEDSNPRAFTNTPLTKTHKVVSTVTQGTDNGNLKPSTTGSTMIGLSANSKAAINPTSDSDDASMRGRASSLAPSYGMGNSGGASGDGRTPGFDGSGSGVSELNGAQGNRAKGR